MSVYGPQLAAFPELMQDFTVFDLPPKMTAGFGERINEHTVTGYWSWRKHSESGIYENARVEDQRATFWAKDDDETGAPGIAIFDCIEKDGDVYQCIEDDEFTHEGGFTRCTMQIIAGLTGREVTNENVDKVIESDYE
jgi:hypothetical protein